MKNIVKPGFLAVLGAFYIQYGNVAGAGEIAGGHQDTALPVTLEESNLVGELFSAAELEVGQRVVDYYRALTTGVMSDIESFVVTGDEFAMVEGKHTNWGWKDYRDHHLVPELEGIKAVSFRFAFQRIEASENLAYVTFLFALSPKGDPTVDYGSGRATAVLSRDDESFWRIVHIHTS